MEKARVMQLFRLFAFLDDARPWQDLADAAIMRVSAELKPDADPEDPRLCYYAAAEANLQYRRLLAARAVTPTYAGTAAAQHCADGQCALAERLMYAYRDYVSDLLKDDSFVFAAIPEQAG